MKKIVKLTETELKNIIKKTINEIDKITIPATNGNPSYKLEISNGALKVTSGNRVFKYKLIKIGMLGVEINLSVLDFPTKTKMKVEATKLGIIKIVNINLNDISNFIKKNLGKAEMTTSFGDHKIKFKREFN